MKIIVVMAFAIISSTPAFAQKTKSDDKPIEFSLEVDIAPQFGAEVPARAVRPVEQSEYGGFLMAKLARTPLNLPASVKVGFAWDPDNFGSNDESNFYVEGVLGDDPYYRRDFRFAGGSRKVTHSFDVKPVISLRWASVSDGFFQARSRDDTTLTGGFTLEDQRCIDAAPVSGPDCKDKPGLSGKAQFLLEKTWSTSPGDGRLTPKVKIGLAGPQVKGKPFIFVRGQFEYRRYDAQSPATSPRLIDARLQATLGVDVAPWISTRRWLGLVDTFEIGAQYARGRSNDPGKNFDRAFFVPSLTFIKKFD